MLSETASSYGEVWHVPGERPITGRGFIDLIFKADGKKPNIGVLSAHDTESRSDEPRNTRIN
jgi:hypothetical protein